MDTPAIIHVPPHYAPTPAEADPRPSLFNLRATLDIARERRTQAFHEKTRGLSAFTFATAEKRLQVVRTLDERCSNAEQALAEADANFTRAIDDATAWLIRTQIPEPPLSMPRSTNRVSYVAGSGYTASSSPITPDPLAVQGHMVVHTDVSTGETSKGNFQHQGAATHSMSFSWVNARGSMHLHVHTFNDSRLAPVPAARKPEHLLVDPDAPRAGPASMVLTPVAEALARYMVRPAAEAECWDAAELGRDLAHERAAREATRLNGRRA